MPPDLLRSLISDRVQDNLGGRQRSKSGTGLDSGERFPKASGHSVPRSLALQTMTSWTPNVRSVLVRFYSDVRSVRLRLA